jgi:hypothetical protein
MKRNIQFCGEVLKKNYYEMKFLGEILPVKVTEEIVRSASKKIENLTLQLGQEIILLVWYGDGMEHWSDEQRIVASFKKQCWKYEKK